MATIEYTTLDRSIEIEWLVDHRKRDRHLLKIKSKELVEGKNSISLTKILHTVLLNSNHKQIHKNNLCLLASIITALQSNNRKIQLPKRRTNWLLRNQSLHLFSIIARHSKFHKIGKASKIKGKANTDFPTAILEQTTLIIYLNRLKAAVLYSKPPHHRQLHLRIKVRRISRFAVVAKLLLEIQEVKVRLSSLRRGKLVLIQMASLSLEHLSHFHLWWAALQIHQLLLPPKTNLRANLNHPPLETISVAKSLQLLIHNAHKSKILLKEGSRMAIWLMKREDLVTAFI